METTVFVLHVCKHRCGCSLLVRYFLFIITVGWGGGIRMGDGRIQDRIISFIIVSTLLEREEKWDENAPSLEKIGVKQRGPTETKFVQLKMKWLSFVVAWFTLQFVFSRVSAAILSDYPSHSQWFHLLESLQAYSCFNFYTFCILYTPFLWVAK